MKKYAKIIMNHKIENVHLKKDDIVEIEEIVNNRVYLKAYGYHLNIDKSLYDMLFIDVLGSIDADNYDSLSKDLSCRHCNSCTCENNNKEKK